MNQKGLIPIAVVITVIIVLAAGGGVFLIYQKSRTRPLKTPLETESKNITASVPLTETPFPAAEPPLQITEKPAAAEKTIPTSTEIPTVYKKQKPKIQPQPASQPPLQPAAPTPQQNSTQQTTKAEFKFVRFPFDIKDIGSVAPVGEFSGITRQTASDSHAYGNMRHYIFSKKPGEYAYNVYVPADGEITGFRNEQTTGQFRFNFKIDDRSFYYFDHIQSLNPEIVEKLKPYFGSPLRFTRGVEEVYPSILVKTGFVLGQTGLKGSAWDWGVIDSSYCRDIIHPEHYYQDRCPRSVYDFMSDEMKDQVALLAGYWVPPPQGMGLQAVKTTPVLGQYAHDVAGTLSGGWFEEYQSWQNAFFIPDPYEPNTFQIRLAVPELSVFGVWNKIALETGNVNPDPKKVTPASEIVSYVLPLTNARDNSEYGVLLVRVNNDETITVETLSGAVSAPANPQFTNKAMILRR